MGLDSGVLVRSTHRKITREMLPLELKYPFEKDYDNEGVEILYWRKNYGLRNAILNTLFPNRTTDDYEFEINTPSQIFDLIKIIIHFMDKETWENEGDSIWDYDEILPILRRDIMNLAIIAAFMMNNPDVYLVFYDSY